MMSGFFARCRPVMLRVLTRRLGGVEDAEDVIQEAFINFERASQMETIGNPEGYLMQIALNLATDKLRQDSSRRRREESWIDTHSAGRSGEDIIAEAPRADDALIAKQELQRLGRILEQLSPQVRTAFQLHKIKGLSHMETAAAMGLSRSTVEKHIMKAMRHIMEQMRDDEV